MMQARTYPAATPWWSQRWPWLLMLGPFIVLLGGLYTGWLAYSQPDSLVVGDYYKRGKAINQDLRRDRAASALGMSAALRYDVARGVLVGSVGGALNAGRPTPQRVLLHLAHATQPERDIKLVVVPAEDGAFEVALPMLERSRWQVLLENEQRDWRLEGSWQWPAQREVTVRAD
ncbi:FixH family protein [Pseudoduganella sp. UC29_71]|uniref:FixH family protein n=1 Tax=Pseudoduganella sp. UC29_71 TaxID=3350174 RepID=UPI00366FC5B6